MGTTEIMRNNTSKKSSERRHRKVFRDFIQPIIERNVVFAEDDDDEMVYPVLPRSLSQSWLPPPKQLSQIQPRLVSPRYGKSSFNHDLIYPFVID